jgi:hypothetical protein
VWRRAAHPAAGAADSLAGMLAKTGSRATKTTPAAARDPVARA